MAHFAKVVDGIVEQVIVAEQDFIDSHCEGTWLQTSYNTLGGVHANGGTPLRKNYAGIGDIYDAGRDAFYTPKPYPSCVLSEDTCLWDAPSARPSDGNLYEWDEDTVSWKEVARPSEPTEELPPYELD